MLFFHPSIRIILAFILIFYCETVIGENEIHSESAMPVIIAHRGASQIAPENTLAAARAAVDAKADWIESDVRALADGSLYLFHDADLKRFNLGKRQVSSLLPADTEALDVGTWFNPEFSKERPPTLQAMLELCLKSDITPLIERKSGTPEAYIEAIRELDAIDKVVLQAFDWDFLEAAKKLEPTLKLGALADKEPNDEQREQLKRLAPDWVGWNQKHLTPEFVAELQKQGIKVAVWTANDLARIRQFVSMGVDGVITDRPAEAREAVENSLPERLTTKD